MQFLRMLSPLLLATTLLVSTTAQAVELQFSHRLDDTAAQRLEKLLERFNTQQKEVQLRLVRRAEGEAPAPLNLVTREELVRFTADRAKFRPLHEVMREAKQVLDGSKLAPELRVGVSDAKGRLAALPLALSTPVLYYNKNAFLKAGLDPENPPRTWWEVQLAADKLFDAGSQCPYTTSWPAWVLIDNLSAWNGAEVVDAKGRLSFNGLVQIKHVAQLASWHKSRFFTYFGRRDEADHRFAAGECGMLTSSSALYATLRDNKTFETGVGALPYYDDVRGAPHQTLADGASLWIGSGFKPADYKGVARFVGFLLGAEMQLELTRAGGFLSMSPQARTAGKGRLGAGLEVAYAQLQGKGALRNLRVSQIEPVRIIVEEELEAVWANRKPAKEALDTAVQRGNAVLPTLAKLPWL